jgi:hypothetical protein
MAVMPAFKAAKLQLAHGVSLPEPASMVQLKLFIRGFQKNAPVACTVQWCISDCGWHSIEFV